MTEMEAEFALRSLAIEMLAIASDAGLSQASVGVTPEDDWWHVSWTKGDDLMSVSRTYGGDDGSQDG